MVRTALFNFAQARHDKGTSVFRIEDTDAARDSEESYEAILDSLRWLALDWDEGPEVGGPYGPYRQSERADIHLDVVRKLDVGEAYDGVLDPRGGGGASPRCRPRLPSWVTTTSTATSPTSSAPPTATRAAIRLCACACPITTSRGGRPGPRHHHHQGGHCPGLRAHSGQRQTALHPRQPQVLN